MNGFWFFIGVTTLLLGLYVMGDWMFNLKVVCTKVGTQNTCVLMEKLP